MNLIEFKEKAGYDLSQIEELRRQFLMDRKKWAGMAKLLDAIDSGEFWEYAKKKIPKHQIIADTNNIYYIKSNLMNNVYAAPYLADVMPMDPDDMEEARLINKFTEYEYNLNNLGDLQLEISDRTALVNVGFLQLGWDDQLTHEAYTQKTNGRATYIKRDPLSVLLDMKFSNYQDGRAIFIDTEDSIENIKALYPDCADEIDNKLELKKSNQEVVVVQNTSGASPNDKGDSYYSKNSNSSSVGVLGVWIAYKKVPKDNGGYRIDQIIYTEQDIVLDYKKDIKPSYFPIIPLYLTPPVKDPYGDGICKRVAKNAVVISILDSIAATHTYGSQRTAWVFNKDSQISLRQIQRDINNPDKVFPVSGVLPEQVLHKLELSQLPPNLQEIRNNIDQAIEKVTMIDEKYTGRDTASVTTTGGMERLQSGVSMSDNSRIALIEKYSKTLTRMMLDFYIEHGGKYQFQPTNLKNEEAQAIVVDFSKYKKQKHKFVFSINASPLLPRNRARMAEAANVIMQTQLQFAQAGMQVKLLEPEEWLFFQDFPQKDMILDRMKLDKLRDDQAEIAAELTSFAAMTEKNMRPEAAIEQLAQERKLRRDPAVRKNILNKNT